MALPSVVALTPTPPGLTSTNARSLNFEGRWIGEQDDAECHIDRSVSSHRMHLLGDINGKAVSAVLPLDVLFEVRVAAARRLWLALNARRTNADPATLSQQQREHFIGALRALDAQHDGATYREIAVVLFGAQRLPERGWKSHDLRDRTIRLARLGNDLMQGGYRQLLLHPFRQRLF